MSGRSIPYNQLLNIGIVTSRIGGTRDEAFVLPIEMGGVVVPHTIGGTCRVEVFAQHQTAGLLQPQLLLELQWAHRRDGLEVVVQTRDAHLQDVQNQTIIFDNYSPALREGASIIITDRDHSSLLVSKGEIHAIQTVRQFRDESLADHFRLHGFWRPITWHA